MAASMKVPDVSVDILNAQSASESRALDVTHSDLYELCSRPTLLSWTSPQQYARTQIAIPPTYSQKYSTASDAVQQYRTPPSVFNVLTESCALITGSHRIHLVGQNNVNTSPQISAAFDPMPSTGVDSLPYYRVPIDSDKYNMYIAGRNGVEQNFNYNPVISLAVPFYNLRQTTWSPLFYRTNFLETTGFREPYSSLNLLDMNTEVPTQGNYKIYHSTGSSFRSYGYIAPCCFWQEYDNLEPPMKLQMMSAVKIAAQGALGGIVNKLTDGIFHTGESSAVDTQTNSYGVLNTSLVDDAKEINTVAVKTEDDSNPKTVSVEPQHLITDMQSIITRRGRCAVFDWESAQDQGTEIWRTNVCPSLCQKTFHYPPSLVYYTDISLNTPLSSFFNSFAYWKGGLHYDFQVIGNKFVQGSLLVAWSPEANHNFTYEEAWALPHTHATISEQTLSVRHTVPWNSVLDAKRTYDISLPEYRDLEPNEEHLTMGTLKVFVVTSLARLEETSPNVFEVNVMLSADDDFKYSVPIINYGTSVATNTFVPNPQRKSVEPALANYVEKTNSEYSLQMDSSSVVTDGPLKVIESSNTNVVDNQIVSPSVEPPPRNEQFGQFSVPLENATSENVLNRSFRIASGTWSPASVRYEILETIELPKDIINNNLVSAPMLRTIATHRYLRSNLKFVLKITASPLSVGALQLFWLPGPLGHARNNPVHSARGLVHGYCVDGALDAMSKTVNIGEERTIEFTVPFLNTLNALSVPFSSDYKSFLDENLANIQGSNLFGTLYVLVFNQLTSANNTVSTWNLEMQFADPFLSLPNENTPLLSDPPVRDAMRLQMDVVQNGPERLVGQRLQEGSRARLERALGFDEPDAPRRRPWDELTPHYLTHEHDQNRRGEYVNHSHPCLGCNKTYYHYHRIRSAEDSRRFGQLCEECRMKAHSATELINFFECSLCHMCTRGIEPLVKHLNNSHTESDFSLTCSCGELVTIKQWHDVHHFVCDYFAPMKCPHCPAVVYGKEKADNHTRNSHPWSMSLPSDFRKLPIVTRDKLVSVARSDPPRKQKAIMRLQMENYLAPTITNAIGTLPGLQDEMRNLNDQVFNSMEKIQNSPQFQQLPTFYEGVQSIKEKLDTVDFGSLSSSLGKIGDFAESFKRSSDTISDSSLLHLGECGFGLSSILALSDSLIHMARFGCVKCLCKMIIHKILEFVPLPVSAVYLVLNAEGIMDCSAIGFEEEDKNKLEASVKDLIEGASDCTDLVSGALTTLYTCLTSVWPGLLKETTFRPPTLTQLPSFKRGIEVILDTVKNIFAAVSEYFFSFVGSDVSLKPRCNAFLKKAHDINYEPNEVHVNNFSGRIKLNEVAIEALELQKLLPKKNTSPLFSRTLTMCDKIIALRKAAIAGSAFTRAAPVVATFQGRTRAGKSVLTSTFLPRLLAQYLNVPKLTTYCFQDQQKHFDGYSHQDIFVIDDFLQHKDHEILKTFNVITSTVDYHVPMADITDKGMKFTSPIVVVSMNEQHPDVASMADKHSLFMRLYKHYVEVVPKPEFVEHGRLSYTIMNKKQEELGRTLLPDDYLDFYKVTYENDKRVPAKNNSDQATKIDRKITFVEFGKEIAEDVLQQEALRKVLIKPKNIVFDVKPIDSYDPVENSDPFEKNSLQMFTSKSQIQHLENIALFLKCEIEASVDCSGIPEHLRFGSYFNASGVSPSTENIELHVLEGREELVRKLIKVARNLDFSMNEHPTLWFTKYEVTLVSHSAGKCVSDGNDISQERQRMASKANSILTIMNLVNSIPLITGVVLAFIALRSGAKWLLGGDSSDIPETAAARYSGGAQAKKTKATAAKQPKLVHRAKASATAGSAPSSEQSLQSDVQQLEKFADNVVLLTRIGVTDKQCSQVFSVKGFALKKHIICYPEHFLRDIKEDDPIRITYRNGPNIGNIEVLYKSEHHLAVHAQDGEASTDLAIFDAGNKIRSFRDLTSYIQPSEVAVRCAEAPLTVVSPDVVRASVDYINLPTCKLLEGQVASYDDDVARTFCTSVQSPYRGQPVLCGSPYISLREAKPMIVGFHSYGSKSVIGATFVTKEDIDALLEALPSEVSIDTEDGKPDLSELNKTIHDSESRIDYENTEFFGFCGGAPTPLKSKFERSVLWECGKIKDYGYLPAPMSAHDEGVKISSAEYLEKVVRKGDSFHPWFPDFDLARKVKEGMKRIFCLKNSSREIIPSCDDYIYSEHQVLNGTGFGRSKPLVVTTSAGFGYPGANKRPFLDHYSDEETGTKIYFLNKATKNQRYLHKQIESCEEHYLKGMIPPQSVWKESTKDELITAEKVEIGKARVIVVPQLHYQYLCKKYTGAFTDAMQTDENRGFKNCSASACEIGELFNEIHEKASGKKFFGADYSRFDSSYPPALIDFYADFIEKWYQEHDPSWQPSHAKARGAIISEGMISTNYFQGNVYGTKASMNSGFPNGHTVFMNWYVNLFLSMYTWCKNTNLEPETFFDNVAPVYMGDDNFQIVLNEQYGDIDVHKSYNRLRLKEVADSVNMIITSPDKKSELTEFDTKMEFMSHEFLMHKEYPGYVFPALKKSSIHNLLLWHRLNDDNTAAEQQSLNIRDAQREACSWGKPYYDRLMRILREEKDNLEAHHITFDDISWWGMVAEHHGITNSLQSEAKNMLQAEVRESSTVSRELRDSRRDKSLVLAVAAIGVSEEIVKAGISFAIDKAFGCRSNVSNLIAHTTFGFLEMLWYLRTGRARLSDRLSALFFHMSVGCMGKEHMEFKDLAMRALLHVTFNTMLIRKVRKTRVLAGVRRL